MIVRIFSARGWCLEAGARVGCEPGEHARIQPSLYAAQSFVFER